MPQIDTIPKSQAHSLPGLSGLFSFSLLFLGLGFIIIAGSSSNNLTSYFSKYFFMAFGFC